MADERDAQPAARNVRRGSTELNLVRPRRVNLARTETQGISFFYSRLTSDSPHLGTDLRGATSLLMHTLFGVLALLLIADLHSSFLAGSALWETNPFMTVLAQRVGPRVALVAIKAADFMCLAGMYALWRRSRAHVVIAIALATAAFVYVDIVLTNYSS